MPTASTRERILRAARRHFAKGGAAGLSLRQVAAQVGVTPMAIYRHFPGKDGLLEALVLDALDLWSERLAALNHEDPLQWLVALGDAFLDFALEEPRRFEAAFLVPSKK